jgi:hypothetical protein
MNTGSVLDKMSQLKETSTASDKTRVTASDRPRIVSSVRIRN